MRKRAFEVVGSALRDLRAMPLAIRQTFGGALGAAQNGAFPENSRPFGEELPREVMKLVEDHDGDTYRAAYVIAFPECVYLLHVQEEGEFRQIDSAARQADDRSAVQGCEGALRTELPLPWRGLMRDEDLTVQRVDDIFVALDIPAPAEARARVDLASAITLEIRRRGLSQRDAAELLGIAQPDVSAIVNARVDGFSQERLERLLNALDFEVRIQVGPRPAWKKRAGVSVELVEAF